MVPGTGDTRSRTSWEEAMGLQMKEKQAGPSARVERLKRRIIDAPQEARAARAVQLTRSISRNWDEHPLTRMSMALADILDNISVIIRDDEVIVGCRTSKLKGAPLFPENKSRWIEGDLDSFKLRVLQRALITDDEKRALREEVLPFWEGRTVEDLLDEMLPADVVEDMDKYVFTMMLEITYGIGHFTMDHPRVLREGLIGMIDDARSRLEMIGDDEASREKKLFYDAVIRSLEATIRFANRYAEQAEAMAEAEDDPARAEELRQVARVCRRVPENPAASFHEAVQSVYFIHLVSQLESGGNSISLGRIDQVLWPYYKADIESGAITPQKARELMSLLFIKTNEIWNVLEEAFIPGGEGTEGKTTQNVTVGGIGIDGEDATNELSYVGLDAYADVRTVQPNFGVRLGSKAPRDLFLKTAEYCKDGVLMHFFNDDAIVESLVHAGLTLEDARDYGVVGCLEPQRAGQDFRLDVRGPVQRHQVPGVRSLGWHRQHRRVPVRARDRRRRGLQELRRSLGSILQAGGLLREPGRARDARARPRDRGAGAIAFRVRDDPGTDGEGPRPHQRWSPLQLDRGSAHGLRQRGGQPVRREQGGLRGGQSLDGRPHAVARGGLDGRRGDAEILPAQAAEVRKRRRRGG